MQSPVKPFVRLAPYIASHSSFSRRQAEQMIIQGRVSMDGHIVKEFVVPHIGRVCIDNQALDQTPDPQLWSYYKPVGELVTRADPEGRRTIFETLRTKVPEGRLISVGRLDYASEGLLLMTNTPSLAHNLETSSLRRKYHVWVEGRLNPPQLFTLSQGAYIEGIRYKPCRIKILENKAGKAHLSMSLKEGKKREIRILLASIGLTVTRLLRISFGPFDLGDLKERDLISIPFDSFASFVGEKRSI